MPNDSWDKLVGKLSGSSGGPSLGEQLAALVSRLQAESQTQPQTIAGAKRPLVEASTKSSGSGIAGTLLKVLGVGSGLSPLVKGLFSLFGGGGGSSEAPPALPKYSAPPSVGFEGLYNSRAGSVTEASTGQDGQIRGLRSSEPMAAQITVNVQAMDSQSFLDRSDDIARAVRLAMLQSNTLNDIVREL